MKTTFFHSDPDGSHVYISDPGAPAPDEGLPGVDWPRPYFRVSTDVTPRMDRVRSRLASEYVVVQDWRDVVNPDIALTPNVLRQLCTRLQCSIPEAVEVISKNDESNRNSFTATEDLHASVFRHVASWTDTDRIDMHHKRRSLALAVAFDSPFAMSVPLSVALGYEGSTARRMEPTLPVDIAPLPVSAESIDLESNVRAFIRHVDLGVRCALDSPQEIILSLKNDVYCIFNRKRMSPTVRGLEVQLSTGGSLFYRDVSLVPGTTDVVSNNRRLPMRKVPYEIINQLAIDIYLGETYHSEVLSPSASMPEKHISTARRYVDWYRENVSMQKRT